MGQLARRRFMRTMRTGPGDFPNGTTGGGGNTGQQQQQQGGQQGAGGGGPPAGQQQGQNNGQQQNGQQNQNQGGQQNNGGSVLDAARQGAGGYDGNQGGQGGQQQNNGQQGGQQGPLSQDVLDAIGRTVQSAVDRHVNTLNNPGGGRNRNNQGGNQNNGNGQQNQGGQGGNDGGQQVHRVDQGARREARLAFREYVSDAMQGRFLSDVERQAAVQMGTAAIATWDGDGDADQYGHQVAQTVAGTIKELAKSYERLTIEGLRKQGRLKDDNQGPGAGSGPAGGFVLPVGGSSGYQLPGIGASSVQQRNPAQAVANAAALAGQYNTRAGHQPAQTATT